MTKRIFSGIQPSGNIHIGNYLGAIRNWTKMQDAYDAIFCIVDLHAITVPQNPVELKKKSLEVAKIYLAAGINPKKSTIFIQSHIQEHTELAWILNTITKMSDLLKMTQFKDKSHQENTKGASVGLFDYPVLMAADILLHNTEVVPVGKDQLQHIELTRTLARRFNKKFGETFIIPKSFMKKETQLIMGLDDPTKKMSKSAPSEYNYISLLDSPELIEKKIKKAVTDSGSAITYFDNRPALKNLINIYSSFSGKTPAEVEIEYKNKGFGDFKTGLTSTILAFIIPFQKKYNSLSDDEVIEILQVGAKKIKPLAQEKMKKAKEAVGLISKQ